ncbi:CHAT domain-containing protein [Thelonectria olida]|uniref:CHAT domain-containing protein n=1 Tax=Thelonectria olida TaxID=1576542 RepID=A0A9P8VXK9_9HYPO|nr:CHAT domain-containing protein [Thelonectria olida]
MKDLEDAIRTARQAVESTPANHPDQAGYLNNFGNLLGRQYERTGEMKDLEDAIQTARQAVESTPANHLNRTGRLTNLGNLLGLRYERTGEMRDLEDAIQTARQAVESMPANHPDRAACLNNLGDQLSLQYERTGEMRDLEEDIQTTRQAVESTPADHPNRTACLTNLGNKLGWWYEWTGEVKDLEEAIQTARQAVESTPANHPDRACCLNNLGTLLGRRYERMGEMRDLEDAIQTARQAVESTPANNPDQAGHLTNLGNLLGLRYERTGEMKDIEEASIHLHNAWDCPNVVPFHRVRAAARCLKMLATQHRLDAGMNLGKAVIDLLPTVHTRVLDLNDQQFVMSTFAGVASDLCAFLLASNRPNDALQYLEQDYPQLAQQYESLVNEVNTPLRKVGHDAAEVQAAKRRREAAAELDACIREIRRTPGRERFLLGRTITEMQECAAKGSIVVVNITEFRSDAILISRNAVKALALSELSASDAKDRLNKTWTAKKRSGRRGKNEEFLEYLSWLWKACVKQILDEIPKQNPLCPGLPRVWWIGTGLGSSMPFHAAGLHTRESTENTYSRVLSSYTPSIKALAHARNRAKSNDEVQATHGSLLIATMPTSPKGSTDKKAPRDLPGVIEEKDKIIEAARDLICTAVVDYPSVDQVLQSLEECRIAHFACHGTSDSSDPSNSGLILQKSSNGPGEAPDQDRLTVHSISELRLRYAQIAYLSACSTAENKAARLSDEVIHVVSGFQVARFPHVVGCLWPAGDSECVEVARRFYLLILQRSRSVLGDGEVASALQEAVMAVRAAEINMPLNWAQFVHYGA